MKALVDIIFVFCHQLAMPPVHGCDSVGLRNSSLSDIFAGFILYILKGAVKVYGFIRLVTKVS